MRQSLRTGPRPAPRRQRPKRPVEYSILYTATLCLLAGGAVMVYSASSAESLLSGSGDASYYLKRYVMLGLIGLVAMHFAARHGLKLIKGLTPILLVGSFALTVAVILYAAQVLAARPRSVLTLGGLFKPLLLVVGAACALLMKQPDMGTAMVVCFSIGALLVAAGTPIRNIGLIGGK